MNMNPHDENPNQNPPPTHPEDIQREFEEFIRRRFGDRVQVITQQITPPAPGSGRKQEEGDRAPAAADKRSGSAANKRPGRGKGVDLRFDYKPKDIKTHLDRYVIKQDEAKKALAIAVCDHYNYVLERLKNPGSVDDQDYAKQNVLILGPTGVGKTYLIKHIAKMIGVPFVKADATRFSETGYVGANVDDLIHDLVNQAGGDIELAQYGIIYLDEADKLAANPHAMGRDVSGRGVQFGMLKLMEETEVDLRSGHDMRSQMQAFMEFQQKGKIEPRIVNTRNILFIISGAFTGLVDIIKQRLNANHIGFATDARRNLDDADFFAHASTEDFIDYGFEPEFIGRLPVRVACHHLSEDDLFRVLKESEGSIIRQYQRAFKAYGIEATFTDDALRAIAVLAAKEKTGARALMTVCERILRSYKYELASLEIDDLVINGDVINHPEEQLKKLLTHYQNTEVPALARAVYDFAQEFSAAHHMELKFTRAAVRAVCGLAEAQASAPGVVLRELLKSYEHGLKLIEQNTGVKSFVIDERVIAEPAISLEQWIRDSYQAKASKKQDEDEDEGEGEGEVGVHRAGASAGRSSADESST